MKKRFLALLLAAVTVSSLVLAGCGKKEVTETEDKGELETLSPANLAFGEDDYASVVKNDSYEMKINATASSIQVVELASGNVWDTQVDSDDIDTKKVNKKWIKKLNSPFEISCTDLEGSFGDVLNYSVCELKYDTTMEKLENGVRVHYDVKDISIKVAIDYMLTADGMSVNIPYAGIDEYGNNSITSIKMFPYLASASDTDDGYYFYPDGSGAIMEFKDISHFKESEVALNVYGNIANYKESIDVLSEQDTEVFLPVFGANINDNGFVAIIEEGDEAAQIKIASTNNIIPVNSLSCEFVYRRAFTDLRIEDGSKLTYDKKAISGDRKVSYHFLEQGKATYSDMANEYRDYLIANGVGEDRAETTSIPLYLELFMAIKEEGFVSDSTVVATSFDEAEEILGELETLGVEDIDLQLRGWTKNGYYTDPVHFPVNSKAGGSKGLKSLLEYTTEKNIDLFLAANFMEARVGAGGYNEQNDVMYLGNSAIWGTNELYILSPDAALENYKKTEKDASKYDISGMSMLSLGQYLVYNYNETNYISQAECMEMWQQMLQSSKEKFGSSVAEGGNAYVLGYADTVMNIPYEDSGYQITTKSVPFYQMAVHGLVNYTGKAGNLSSDLGKDSLKWVEYGYIPYFELTHSGSEDLMYTDYNTLYSSTYSAWLDDAASIYVDFNKNLTDVSDAYMESHEEVATDVFKVTYSNGAVIYVNYNADAVTVDGVTVEAESYVVKKG